MDFDADQTTTPSTKQSTTGQTMDSVMVNQQKPVNKQKLIGNGMNLKGPPPPKQPKNVQLTQDEYLKVQEQLALKMGWSKLEKQWQKLEREQQLLDERQDKLYQHQEKVEQRQRAVMKEVKEVTTQMEAISKDLEEIDLKEQKEKGAIKNLDTSEEFQCCCNTIHVKMGTYFIAFCHTAAVTFALASILIDKYTIEDPEQKTTQLLPYIKTAGAVFSGLCYVPLFFLLAGILLKKSLWLKVYLWLGMLEMNGALYFMITLCIQYDQLTQKELGIDSAAAIVLTITLFTILIGLRTWWSYVVYKCSIYYDKKSKA